MMVVYPVAVVRRVVLGARVVVEIVCVCGTVNTTVVPEITVVVRLE